MVLIPGRGNPFDSEDDRRRMLNERDFGGSRRWVVVVAAGVALPVVFGILAVLGFPGAGLLLVPIGLGMVLGGGIQLLLDHISG
jgi:hypothetical protein